MKQLIKNIDMDNKQFVKDQFRIFKKRGVNYRNVLMLTSFIESIVRDQARQAKKRKDFKHALEILGLDIDRTNGIASYNKSSQYKDDCLIEINDLRVQRNELLHDIIKEKLPQKYINDTIKKMGKNIRLIYTKSQFICNYFKNNFHFDIWDEFKGL